MGGLGIAPFRTDPLALHLRRARAGPHLQATPPGSLTVMAVTVTVTLSHAHFGIVEAQWFCNGRARESKAPIGTGSMPLLPGQLPVGPSSPDSAGRFEPVRAGSSSSDVPPDARACFIEAAGRLAAVGAEQGDLATARRLLEEALRTLESGSGAARGFRIIDGGTS